MKFFLKRPSLQWDKQICRLLCKQPKAVPSGAAGLSAVCRAALDGKSITRIQTWPFTSSCGLQFQQ